MNSVSTHPDPTPNPSEIDDALARIFRSWDERLLAGADPAARERLAAFVADLPAGYKQDIRPDRARVDLAILGELSDGAVDVRIVPDATARGTHRLSLYVGGRPASLGDLMPLLQSL
ncbi:glutamate dehydrogenase, partial [Rhodococcus hoagii]|nr:glutamate dehydrogenase [Prescottella equi]